MKLLGTPSGTDAVAGKTLIDVRSAVTVSDAALLIVPEVAVIVTWPTAIPVARPDELMVATFVFDESHLTEFVMSPVEPSEYLAVAWYRCVPFIWMVAVAGEMAIPLIDAAVTVRLVEPVTPAYDAEIVEVPGAFPVASPRLEPLVPIVATDVLDELQFTIVVKSASEPSL